jgi:hypothetical protein
VQKIRGAARCAVFHLAPPPPKQDVDHILSNPDSDFTKAGILENGVSPAPLRLKLWELQMRVLRKLCEEWDVGLVPPPGEAVDSSGFLKRDYYAKDATHANAAYGELVLRQLERLAAQGEMVAQKIG